MKILCIPCSKLRILANFVPKIFVGRLRYGFQESRLFFLVVVQIRVFNIKWCIYIYDFRFGGVIFDDDDDDDDDDEAGVD